MESPHVNSAPAPATSRQATVNITVAPGASLAVDGKQINLASDSQVFVTPELDPSRVYFYEMTARAKKDGKEFSASKKVEVRAGRSVSVDLTDLKPWKGSKKKDDDDDDDDKKKDKKKKDDDDKKKDKKKKDDDDKKKDKKKKDDDD